MRQIRHLVFGLDARSRAGQRAPGVAIVPRYDPGAARESGELLEDVFAAHPAHLTPVPRHLECLPTLGRLPVAVGNDRDPGVDLHHLPHPRDSQSSLVVVGGDRTAECGAACNERHQHAFGIGVDAESGSSGDLVGQVEPPDGLPYELEVLRILE